MSKRTRKKRKRKAIRSFIITAVLVILAFWLISLFYPTEVSDYFSETQCNEACLEAGYKFGLCKSADEAKENEVNYGSCLIKNTIRCGSPGQCQCYCRAEETETLSVSQLLENPDYESSVKIKGVVSLKGELFCPCFKLSSGGKDIDVWYGLMGQPKEEGEVCCEIYGLGAYMKKVNIQYEWMQPEECKLPEDFVGGGREQVADGFCALNDVDVSEIENGDEVIVTGIFRDKQTFWARKIEKI